MYHGRLWQALDWPDHKHECGLVESAKRHRAVEADTDMLLARLYRRRWVLETVAAVWLRVVLLGPTCSHFGVLVTLQ